LGLNDLKASHCGFLREDAENFFRPSVEVILNDLRSRFKTRDVSVTALLSLCMTRADSLTQALILTGGFGESPYVKGQLEKAFTGTTMPIVLSNAPKYI
jgi:hypothetical protein